MTESETYIKIAAFCSSAEHCLSEVKERLSRWGVDEQTAASVCDKLVAQRFVDETRYCRAFIRDKYLFSHWGRYKIGYALSQKQISSSVYTPLLEEIDREEYLEKLTTLLQTKTREVKGRTAYERKSKLIRFALGRGFLMDEILHCLPDLQENE